MTPRHTGSVHGISRSLRTAFWAGGLAILACTALAADPSTQKGTDTANPAPAAAERSPRRTNDRKLLNDVVAIGDDAHVRAGQVADDVVVIHGTANIEGDVNGDVVVVLGKLTVTGRVKGDVVVVLGEAEINGPVGGELAMVLTGGALGPRADIRGQMVAVGNPPTIDPEAIIHHHPELISFGPLSHYVDLGRSYLVQGVCLLRPFPPRLGWVWVFAGVFLVFHLFVALLFASPLRSCMQTLRDQPARSFLIGLLACVLIGPISLLLSFTVVAPPLICLAFFALCIFGRVAVYGTAGAGVLRIRDGSVLEHPVMSVLVGSILFYIAYMIPVLGFALFWLVLPWGVGAALLRVFEALRSERRAHSTPGGGLGATDTGLAAASGLSAGEPGPVTQALTEGPVILNSAEGNPPPVGPATAGPTPTTPLQPPVVALALSGIELAAARRVGFWLRCAASLIDIVLISFVAFVVLRGGGWFWILLAGYHFGMWAWRGTTLGGAILGLRIIRLDGRAVDWQTSAIRLLGSLVSLLPLGLGFFWVSWDDQFQSWHDRIAGTTIVRADRRLPLI